MKLGRGLALLLPLLVVGLIIASPKLTSPASGGIRVMTYNIEWFSEDSHPERIQNIKTVLDDIKPFVVGVQEVQSKKALEQIFDSSWQIAIKDETSEVQEVALAVKAPYKVLEFDTIFKDPGLDYAFPGKRDALRVVVQTPDQKKISFYVLHNKSRSGGRLQTDPQREMAMGLLAAYIKNKAEANVVVLGDMNDSPADVSVNILESGHLYAKGGRYPPSLLKNISEPLYEQDYVTFGLSTLFQGSEVSPIVKDSKAENERTRGINYRYPQDLKVTQVFFDQIIVSPSVNGTVNVYSKPAALRGTAGRQRRRDDGSADYQQKGTRASDHLPVYSDLSGWQ